MSTTALGAIRNGLCNLETIATMAPTVGRHPIFLIGLEQIKNGVTAIENGCNPNDVIQDNMFSPVRTVPDAKK